MMDILVKIKRLVLTGNVLFTKKAELELDRDNITEDLVCEAIINAPGISKKLRSVNPESGQKEYQYVIIGLTFDDTPIYTKGKLIKADDSEKFYVLISSKKSVN
jgi:hypothetical protein